MGVECKGDIDPLFFHEGEGGGIGHREFLIRETFQPLQGLELSIKGDRRDLDPLRGIDFTRRLERLPGSKAINKECDQFRKDKIGSLCRVLLSDQLCQ